MPRKIVMYEAECGGVYPTKADAEQAEAKARLFQRYNDECHFQDIGADAVVDWFFDNFILTPKE